MIEINPKSSTPLYDQIKAGLRGLVLKGLLKPGDQAPSIRTLAVRLCVNPNTVARAYRELTLEGFFEAKRGEGNTISLSAVHSAQNSMDHLRGRVLEALRQVRRGGLSWQEIEAVLEQVKGEKI